MHLALKSLHVLGLAGAIATLAPTAAISLMVLKPGG